MGTSKGYIAPTTSHWSTAKRAVTAFINNRDFDSKAKAASKYATAMKTDMSTGGSFQSAAARTLGFAQKVASGGLDNALREYNREDLIGKPSEVVWTELLHEFTNSGASVEDNMAADALSQAMDNLEIEDIADIGNVSVDILLKEMLKEYIKENFDFRYEEKISKGKTPAQTSAILNDMHEYIENSIDGDLNLDNLKSVDFSNMGTSQIVEDALRDALSVFEKYYGEEVDKEQEKKPDSEWKDAYVFSINRKQYSTIFTNITNSWYRMDQMQIPAIYEDLFIIGLSIFALDKRVSRRRFKNCWTRDINVSIPVLEYDKWKDTGLQWEKMLGFLTGDHWHIVFRKSEVIYSYREHANRIHLNVQDCDCVCLFSGGLDSFCGAIRLLEEGGSPCLVGHNEYPKLAKRQNLFVRTFQDLYPEQSVKFISFTANSRAPISEKEGILKGSENTSRGRSLLFLCAALSVAGILGENVPVYIPENGFIGLNIPLTGGRKGTCSTRTTHPYFLRQFNGILEQVGIKNTITNFFAYNTKREIVGQVKDTDAFKSCYADTISCSHPCLARYNKKGSKEYPVNCGYCYPCLIRKSSLLDIDEIKKYSYQGEAYDFLIEYEESEKSADLRAVLGSIYRCKHSSDKELKRYIRCVGELTEEEVEKFLSLYKKSIEDLVQLFSADQRMKEYLGL